MKRISIKSTWMGWGSKDSSLEINSIEEGFVDSKGRMLPVEYIDGFLVTLKEEPVTEINFASLEITQDWLEKLLEKVIEEQKEKEATPEEIRIWIDSWKSIDFLERNLRKYYQGGWTDDYPEINIKIELNDGNVINVSSDSQYAFMIPWKIKVDDSEVKTNNVRISKALSKLLPDDFTNKDRLSEKRLEYKLPFYIRFTLMEKLDKAGAESRLGVDFRPIKDKFSLIKSAIQYIYSIDLDGQQGWNAILGHPDWPQNLTMGIHFELKNEDEIDVNTFLENYNKYVQLFLSNLWLMKFIKENPEYIAEIRFVNNQSMSEKASESFLEDLREHNRKELADEIEGVLDGSSFVIATGKFREGSDWIIDNYSRWVLLPDKRSVLWHWRGDVVLNWRTSDFKTWDYHGHFAAGTVISPEGEIQHNL